MQSFTAGHRQIAMAWLFNWEDRKPAGSPYSGEMSLPREVSLDRKGSVCLNPATEFDALPRTAVSPDQFDTYLLVDASFEVVIPSLPENFVIEALQGRDSSFKVSYEDGELLVTLPQDDASIRYSAKIPPGTDLLLVYDRGILEIFGESGAVCGTRRGYRHCAPDQLVLGLAPSDVSVNQIARQH